LTDYYLDLRLAQTGLKLAELEKKLYRMEARIHGGIGAMLVVAVLVQHFWR
jgi:NOL1/NOP2/fmu family ribosome biogenesis protein